MKHWRIRRLAAKLEREHHMVPYVAWQVARKKEEESEHDDRLLDLAIYLVIVVIISLVVWRIVA